MKPNNNRAITLIELIISVVLLGMVMLGFYGIDMFSRQQFLAADKRSKVQNEANYALSHMSKHLLAAIGDFDNPAVIITSSGANNAKIVATIDSVADGVRNTSSGSDCNIGYCFNDAGCNAAAQAYTILFNSNISSSSPPAAEVIARHVRSFNVTQNGNYLTMHIITCWQPSGTPKACGTLDNPAMNLTNIIKMPSVSAQ
ncbi:MAG: prepilin-type N-terminal cleavage/methylation domain-containing protein [Candidatus Omnitrophica bacterium]|nr:prepilin-type N-terminal cleavage/methylation domain-containing protein [Candidatus Omnitrophota bacterium]